MRCPKCGATEKQVESYDCGKGLIIVCLICGYEWPQREAPNKFYADGSKIPKELPF